MWSCKYILTLLFLLPSVFFLRAEQSVAIPRAGLYFSSFTVDKNKRTGLNLTPEKDLVFKKGFTLSFDIRLREEAQSFGYVFRIVCNDTVNIDLVSDVRSPKYLFALIKDHRNRLQFRKGELKGIADMDWIPVSFTFDSQRDSLELTIQGVRKMVGCSIKDIHSFSIFFGGNNHRDFATTDVSPMSIRNIRIYNEKQTLERYWELGKHTHTEVYDSCSHAKATVQNPLWLIDFHVKWKKECEIRVPASHVQYASDPEEGCLFIVNRKLLMVYNVQSNVLDTIMVKKGLPYKSEANQLIYDSNNRELISYDFASPVLVRFNFTTKEWSQDNEMFLRPYYWHHSKLFLSSDSMFITIGGYGYHRYKGSLMKYAMNKNKWEEYDISSFIFPRYLGSMGLLNDKEFLYFGGLGNESGNQEEYPRCFYDLYRINAGQMDIRKVWSMSDPEEHYTNSNSMVVDRREGVFYTLTYPDKQYLSHIVLREFNLNEPRQRIVSDTIPYIFNDIESYCDLFLCRKTEKIIAYTSHLENKETVLNIYSINYRPFASAEILQEHPPQKGFRDKCLLPVLLLILATGLFFMVGKNKRKSKGKAISETTPSNPQSGFQEPVSTPDNNVDAQSPSVKLLGNFCILDKEREDITSLFSSTIAQLFLLCLLATVKNGKGISSRELKDILWYDKDEDSARNNRNVHFSKLRLVLKKVGDIAILNKNDYWSVAVDDTVQCDYKYTMDLIAQVRREKTITKEQLDKLLKYSSGGLLLPNLQAEWLDAYKSEYTNLIIETLQTISRWDSVKNDLDILLKISEVVLIHDNIDEEAVKMKCFALFRLGKKGQSKQCFEKFLKDYKVLLDSEYSEENFKTFISK